MHIDVTCVQSLIFVRTSSAPEAFHVVLEFSLHYTTNYNNVSADARIDKIVPYLAVNCFWHFSCINVLNVRVDFLDSDPLKE